MPISWQGWALYAGLLSAVSSRVGLDNRSDMPVVLVAALAPITIVFMVIAAWKTRGGWRWRWGEDE